MKFFKKVVVLITFSFVFWSALAFAEDSAKKLNKVITQITQVKTNLKKNKKKHSSVKQKLAELKKRIYLLETRLKKTAKQFIAQKEVLAKLNRDRSRQQSKLQDAQNQMLSQISLAHQLESKNNLKAVFNGYRKASPDLLLAYHKYIFIERLSQMRNINQMLDQLESNRKKIDQETRRLKKLEDGQSKDKLSLEKSKAQQREILDGLSSKIATQNKKLQKLLVAKKNLEKLVDKIAPYQLAKMTQQERSGFCKYFVWPTSGSITTSFGSSIEQSNWTWNGIIIQASLGQDVRAALAGKVIYADRLSGYGLLLIIDHGNGYMSLYGHNSVLHKALNSWVEAGDIISKVGESDAENTQLYFAIRYNGKPVDPEKWCR